MEDGTAITMKVLSAENAKSYGSSDFTLCCDTIDG